MNTRNAGTNHTHLAWNVCVMTVSQLVKMIPNSTKITRSTNLITNVSHWPYPLSKIKSLHSNRDNLGSIPSQFACETCGGQNRNGTEFFPSTSGRSTRVASPPFHTQTFHSPTDRTSSFSRLRLKCDGTRAETRILLSAKRTSTFKSAGGRQFSRLLAAEVCTSAVVMLDTPCSEVV